MKKLLVVLASLWLLPAPAFAQQAPAPAPEKTYTVTLRQSQWNYLFGVVRSASGPGISYEATSPILNDVQTQIINADDTAKKAAEHPAPEKK